MVTKYDEINLVSEVMYALGYELNPNNIVIDQDNTIIAFNGKSIKATRNINKQAYISDNDVLLDPINPKCTALMKSLMVTYVTNGFMEGEFPKMITFFEDQVLDKFYLVIKFENGYVFKTSTPFRCKALLYTSAILELNGYIGDLTRFDIDESGELR